MIINHNLAALNTLRQMNVNATNTQKSLEKLSSGLRINSAADDAAGLAISEKMRGQISGLEMAQKNSQDGISLISTAEGALNETHSILQRMRELSVQSANDTNTDDDRKQMQQEVDQLSQELTRIGNDTEFNTQNLLDGSFSGTFQIGANEDQNLSLKIDDMRGYTLNMAGDVKFSQTVTTSGTIDYKDGTYTIDGTDLKNSAGAVVATTTDNGTTWTSTTNTETITFADAVDSGQIVIANGQATGTANIDNGGLQAGDYTLSTSSITDSQGNVIATSTDATNYISVDGNATTLVTLDTATTGNIDVSVGGIDISSQSSANTAITAIDNAINKVSTQRSALGAYQNRLEHTINNLGTSSQNLTAAESRIRDVDMAKEMAEFTKNNILNQAAQAMLAQANQLPQGVLQLLR